MSWFRELFRESLLREEDAHWERDPLVRGCQLRRRFRTLLHQNVAMGLLGHHQLAFSFLMAAKVHEVAEGLPQGDPEAAEFREQLHRLEAAGPAGKPGVLRRPGAASAAQRSDANSQAAHSDQGRSAPRSKAPQRPPVPEEDRTLSVLPGWLNYLLTGLLAADAEIEKRPLPAACADFLNEKQWRKVLELATFDCFDALPD